MSNGPTSVPPELKAMYAAFASSAEKLTYDELAASVTSLREQNDYLLNLINTPRVDDFIEGVRVEAAHQVTRWGVEHDAGKRPEDWITLFMYLLGKAAKAHFDGNHEKLLHHIVTVGAVALNWHANATGVDTRMRPGIGPASGETQRGR